MNGLIGFIVIAAIVALIIGGLVYSERRPGFWEAQRRRRSEGCAE